MTSVPNSIPVFFNTPRLVIPYRFFSTGTLSNIFIKIRPGNHMDLVIRYITGRILVYGHVIKISRVRVKKGLLLK
jgi:hypothetical protein